ncbi:hypothetical protein FGB62_425g05 [Gracilaria domingensis]|nr:hypothetical protein FGB62_425g05 [Gracilaria domingensis]
MLLLGSITRWDVEKRDGEVDRNEAARGEGADLGGEFLLLERGDGGGGGAVRSCGHAKIGVASSMIAAASWCPSRRHRQSAVGRGGRDAAGECRRGAQALRADPVGRRV